MKKIISFGESTAILARSNSAGIIKIDPAPAELAKLADAINEYRSIDVITILPEKGKIVFVADKCAENAEITFRVASAIAEVFNVDTSIRNARDQNAV